METLLACAIVLIVGHLPMPGQRGGTVRSRLAAAGGAAQAYLAHVLRETDAEDSGVLREAGAEGSGALREAGAEGSGVLREAGAEGSGAVQDTGAEDLGALRHTGVQDSRALRWTLRREAYRALAEARAAIALAAAELPALARHSEGADEIVAVLERLVDTTTACAVHLDDSGRLTPRHVRRLAELLDELGELDRPAEGAARVAVRLPELPLAG